ncbi:von Willebrand factor A domain-containing protein 5A-like [Hyperolius riggenbachi]|uniref:von Willebrand factor A domain-containing protein 5A-like n=1 Tax=Hyperolius riggenbachi TaxID=752182 RepID=UPI0035A356D7
MDLLCSGLIKRQDKVGAEMTSPSSYGGLYMMYPCEPVQVCDAEFCEQVPLQGIWVDVQVKGFVADVSATLKYKNEKEAADVVFVFPVDKDSAVYSFEATIEGKKIIADLQVEKTWRKIERKYLHEKRQAFVLDGFRHFGCSIGNLPAGEQTEVTLSYVQELPVGADGAVRFVLPAVLNPRYPPADHELDVPVTPPLLSPDVPYMLSAHFQSAYGIARIESNCDITPMEYTDSNKTGAKVSLVEGHKFDRDVELMAYYTDIDKPSITVEAGLAPVYRPPRPPPRVRKPSGVQKLWKLVQRNFSSKQSPQINLGPAESIMVESVAMLNFYPMLLTGQEEQSNCGEFIFVVDRSEYMGSICQWQFMRNPNLIPRIERAKEMLVLLLKNLPLGCYFNIYGFGSHLESFFPKSVEFTQESREEAMKKVKMIEANLGRGEILKHLKKIFKTPVIASHPRQIFLFTSVGVENDKQVIAEVQKNAHKHQFFTFQIGEGTGSYFIHMARAEGITAEFISEKDHMQPKVLQTLKYALQPSLKDISLTWTLPLGVEAIALSHIPTTIFHGQKLIIYVQLKGKVEDEAEGEVCLNYTFMDKIVKHGLRFPLKVKETERPTIHRLAAKTLISELQLRDSMCPIEREKVLEASLQSGVISFQTVVVAVNSDTKSALESPVVCHSNPYHGCTMGKYDNLPCKPSKTSALGRLISLQNANGSWSLVPELWSILEISEVDRIPNQNVTASVWATVLAVVWLYHNCRDMILWWERLKWRAVQWVVPRAGSSLAECVRAANDLLRSSVDLNVFKRSPPLS